MNHIEAKIWPDSELISSLPEVQTPGELPPVTHIDDYRQKHGAEHGAGDRASEKQQDVAAWLASLGLKYRMVEVLAEFELADGVIESGSLGVEMKRRTGFHSMGDIYAEDIKSLIKIDCLNQEGQTYNLTEQGQAVIAGLKEHSELIPDDRNKSYVRASTALQVLELILQELGFDYDQYDPNSEKYMTWLYPLNTPAPLLGRLSPLVDMDEDSLLRRIGEIRTGGLIETDITAGALSNIRLTDLGVAYAVHAREVLREKEKVIDEALLHEVESMVVTSVELAEDLGRSRMAAAIKSEYLITKLLALEPSQFQDVHTHIKRKLSGLYAERIKQLKQMRQTEAAA